MSASPQAGSATAGASSVARLDPVEVAADLIRCPSVTPEEGGDALDFGKNDLQQQASEPKQGQRFGYDTKQADGGKTHATNLHPQEQGEKQGKNDNDRHREQAEQQQG